MAPSVIIGVGGIGSDICARIAKLLPENAPDRDEVRFVIMDTDVNTITELHREGFRGIEIQLSDNVSVKMCRERIAAETSMWYPSSTIFDHKSMTEGAGQQRYISRLALDYAIRQHKLAPLETAIKELTPVGAETKTSKQPISFYIISSLAGGTGSGIILPLAMYINQLILETKKDEFLSCKGFFVLSSALREHVDSWLERKSLDSNAYASIKELSAFMRLADGDTERYENVGMLLPYGDTSGYKKYHEGSYEYCFLFGMTNENGKVLRSFEELKNMIANAVYIQAFSPMSGRNSSREDNIIKHITSKMIERGQKSLSRFGSIGCGEMVYPYQELQEYYALRWAIESMSGSWKKYDQQYFMRIKEERERKLSGKKAMDVFRGNEYINAVLQADKTDLLGEEIRKSCKLNNGSNIWDGYLTALWTEIDKGVNDFRAEKEKEEGSAKAEYNDCLEVCKEEKVKFAIRRTAALSLSRVLDELVEEVDEFKQEYTDYCKTVFLKLHPLIEEQDMTDMEYWLKKDGSFIHPNAVRFFLYNLLNAIETRIKKERVKEQQEKGKIVGHRAGNGMKGRLIFNKDFLAISQEYHNVGDAVYEEAKYGIYLSVLEACYAYTQNLVRNYEEFYDSFDDMLMFFSENCIALEEVLDQKRGVVRAHVCADRECREKIFEELKATSEFVRTGSMLSQYIFELLHSPVKKRADRKSLFRRIENYWKEAIIAEYSDKLDMNILHAMDKEEEIKWGGPLNAESMKDRIGKMRDTLIAPFLQYTQTAGEQQGISICCFHSELNEEHGKFKDVVSWLKEREGVDDPFYCTRYQMIFYHSFVGLDASEVMEYAHGGSRDIEKRVINAFNLYNETIVDMGKAKGNNSQVTPHIDSRWNSLLELPDISEAYQRAEEIRIGKAFLYAVLYKYIRKENNGYVFSYNQEIKGLDKQYTLMDCHTCLYENQFWVRGLLHEMEQRIADNGADEMKERMKSYQEGKGFLAVLIDYSIDIKKENQDMARVRILLEALESILASCCEGNSSEIKEQCRDKMEEGWNTLRNKGKYEENNRITPTLSVIRSYFTEKGYRCNEG